MDNCHGTTQNSYSSTYGQELSIHEYLEGIDDSVFASIQKIATPITKLEELSDHGFFSSPENSPANTHVCESR
jgi:hypothetical protein